MKGPHGVAPTEANVLGIVSLILWSLTLVVTVKYLVFLMRADNRGEGGIMALLALVPERLRAPRPGRVGPVALLVIVGAALLFGDGIITPAISVLSAVEGLEVATTSLSPVVVPLTVAILVGLFAIQSRGTGGLGRLFGPVMVVWFVTIGALGGYHVVKYPAVLAAVSPVHGARFFAEHGFHGLRTLGGVVLAVTGGEALYADMGQFGARPIRRAWLGLVYPALMICYLGQGATLIQAPAKASNPFYGMLPPGPWIFPLVALAAFATVIASQALISGVFSMTAQAIQLSFFPRVVVRHTSKESEGQIYLPLLNVGLAVSCIVLVLVFRSSSRLAAAFGLAVSGTMLITSVVFWVVTRHTWGWSPLKAGALLALFLSFDVAFVVANALKFFDGGYLPFLVGVFFVLVMSTWRAGRGLLADLLRASASSLDELRAQIRRAHRIPGLGVFMASHADSAPPVLTTVLRRFQVAHERVVLLTVTTEHVPEVPADERAEATDLGDGLVRVVLRFGFMEEPDVPRGLAKAFEALGWDASAGEARYFLGRETLVATDKGRMGRRREAFFAWMSRNARSATDHFRLPPDQVTEIGAQLDL